jgi:NADPH:quinone reductase-like Zn-dependent oxidoreductase
MAFRWRYSVEVTSRGYYSRYFYSYYISRVSIICGRVQSGQNVLITGIGGGVALIAMQICIAKGASVYVTSGSERKVQKAITFGAKGGANYKDGKSTSSSIVAVGIYSSAAENWPSQIGALLAKDKQGGGVLDIVIDSGGGEIMAQTSKILKRGGRVVCYGMYRILSSEFTGVH